MKNIIQLVTTLLIISVLLTTCLCTEFRIVTSIPVIKYVVKELLNNKVQVYVLYYGNVNPHTIKLKPWMISYVENSNFVISLSHFPYELRIEKYCIKSGIPVLKFSDYMEYLILLKYPEIEIINTHGWWLYINNIEKFSKILLDKFVQLGVLTNSEALKVYGDFVEKLRDLKDYSKKFVELRNYSFICSPPFQYFLKNFNVNCTIVLKEHISQKDLVKLKNIKKPVVILLANYEKDSVIDRYLKSVLNEKPGVICYLSVIGNNTEVAYTKFMTYLIERFKKCLTMLNNQVKVSSINSVTNINPIYITILLVLIFVIALMIFYIKRSRT